MSAAPLPGPEPQKEPPAATQADVQPSEHEVIGALASVEQATRHNEPILTPAAPQATFETSRTPIYILFALLIVFALIAATGIVIGGPKLLDALLTAGKNINIASKSSSSSSRGNRGPNRVVQQQAEDALAKAIGGDNKARVLILENHRAWTGQTTRTQKMTQLIDAGINANDMEVRHATLLMQLAVDGVTVDQQGFDWLRKNLANSKYRGWALWMLGAIGNLDVNPDQAAKLISSYLNDPDPQTRDGAVNGLAILGSDETIPILLDHFRNDASPVVQESAARGLAVSGMYTHEQRLRAAGTMIDWLDDARTTPAQKVWVLHALRDISGKNVGSDSAAWRQWYAQTMANR